MAFQCKRSCACLLPAFLHAPRSEHARTAQQQPGELPLLLQAVFAQSYCAPAPPSLSLWIPPCETQPIVRCAWGYCLPKEASTTCCLTLQAASPRLCPTHRPCTTHLVVQLLVQPVQHSPHTVPRFVPAAPLCLTHRPCTTHLVVQFHVQPVQHSLHAVPRFVRAAPLSLAWRPNPERPLLLLDVLLLLRGSADPRRPPPRRPPPTDTMHRKTNCVDAARPQARPTPNPKPASSTTPVRTAPPRTVFSLGPKTASTESPAISRATKATGNPAASRATAAPTSPLPITLAPAVKLPPGFYILGLPPRPSTTQLQDIFSSVSSKSHTLAQLGPAFQLAPVQRKSRRDSAFLLSHPSFVTANLLQRIMQELSDTGETDSKGAPVFPLLLAC